MTEWRAESSPLFGQWRVVERSPDRSLQSNLIHIIADNLDEPTAKRIAAVNEMETALLVTKRELEYLIGKHVPEGLRHNYSGQFAADQASAALAKAGVG